MTSLKKNELLKHIDTLQSYHDVLSINQALNAVNGIADIFADIKKEDGHTLEKTFLRQDGFNLLVKTLEKQCDALGATNNNNNNNNNNHSSTTTESTIQESEARYSITSQQTRDDSTQVEVDVQSMATTMICVLLRVVEGTIKAHPRAADQAILAMMMIFQLVEIKNKVLLRKIRTFIDKLEKKHRVGDREQVQRLVELLG